MKTQEEIAFRIKELLLKIEHEFKQDHTERYAEDTITWLQLNGKLRVDELEERRYKLYQILDVINYSQRKNYRLYQSFSVELETINWLLS